MNKAVKPEQLLLSDEVTREEAEIRAERPTNAPPENYDDFDWSTDKSVVLRSQRATAVYFNRRGDLVIRQEREWDEDSDPFMLITEHNIDPFLERLTVILGIPSVGGGK